MDVRAELKRLMGWARAALADLFDQNKPFGRLAMVHALMTAAMTALTVGLAGTLFFSIKPGAAEGKVLLYLLITIAPFAVVSPALSPLLDRGRQARRTATIVAAAGSALLCVAMATSVNSPLLFPEAFGILVLSKLYLVTRAALVPAVSPEGADLASANARLAVLAGIAGFAISPVAVLFLQVGAPAVMVIAAIAFTCAAVAGLRLPRTAKNKEKERARRAQAEPDGAVVSIPSPVPAGVVKRPGPGAGLVKRPPQQFDPRGVDPAVTAAAAASAGTYGPPAPGQLGPASALGSRTAGRRQDGQGGHRFFSALSPRLDVHSPEVTLALSAVSVLRGSLGFVTFFLAFALKRHVPPAATWLYGLIVLASGVGGLAGSALVPWLRRHLSEERIILFSLVAAAVFAGLTALLGGLWAQPLLTTMIALTATTSKPSFDSLAQRHISPLQQGRAFAMFETRLQLVWVIAAVMAVVIVFNFGGGDVVICVSCAISAIFYGSMGHSIRRHVPSQGIGGAPVVP